MKNLDQSKLANDIAFATCQLSLADTAAQVAKAAQDNQFTDPQYQKFSQTVNQFRSLYIGAVNADKQAAKQVKPAAPAAAPAQPETPNAQPETTAAPAPAASPAPAQE